MTPLQPDWLTTGELAYKRRSPKSNEFLTLIAPPFIPVEDSKMQVFRITLSDGARKFHTQFHAPDASFAEMKTAYHFDTSKWKIVSVTHVGAVAA